MRIDPDLVESDRLHLLPDPLDHRAFMAGLGWDGDQVAQELHDCAFAGLRACRQAATRILNGLPWGHNGGRAALWPSTLPYPGPSLLG